MNLRLYIKFASFFLISHELFFMNIVLHIFNLSEYRRNTNKIKFNELSLSRTATFFLVRTNTKKIVHHGGAREQNPLLGCYRFAALEIYDINEKRKSKFCTKLKKIEIFERIQVFD